MNKTDQKAVICSCGARMILRHSTKFNKDFFGCETYPKCKNTHSADKEGRAVGIPAGPETRKLRTELHKELKKYFSSGQWHENVDDRAKFLQHHTGETKVAMLNKDQIRKLLKRLRKT